MEPNERLNNLLLFLKRIIPLKIFRFFQPAYHYVLAVLGALLYRFPSRNIYLVLVTGTKGKSTVVELVNEVLEKAGYKTAFSSTVRTKIDKDLRNNMYKMTLPGRFFLQSFLRRAVNKGCQYAIVEMPSEAVIQFRHLFIEPDALIFTNIAREHIEAHGSFENYVNAKLEIAKKLETSSKKDRIVVVNSDDDFGKKFLDIDVEKKHTYSLSDAEPYTLKQEGFVITLHNKILTSKLSGVFNIYNVLAAITFAESQNIDRDIIQKAIESFDGVPGRLEKIELPENNPQRDKQDFTVVVDYAHTPDSLENVYSVFGDSKNICVLGSAGGGRDVWKRPEMGRVASKHCNTIILTNEDPYDENPRDIIENIKEGIKKPGYLVIMDRREAIHKAISLAKKGSVVLITGKGSEPYIMEKNGQKTPWNDARVAREELEKVLEKK